MSEPSDDPQAKGQGPIAPEQLAAPAVGDPDEDVEVLVQDTDDAAAPFAPVPAPAAAPARLDSVPPGSRKLAPPPKPKRDSTQPASMPPPAADDGSEVVVPRPSSAPAAASGDVVAAALASGASLKKVGEVLAQDAGAFAVNEAPSGERERLRVPRPGSQPALSGSVKPRSRSSRPPSGAPPKPKAASPFAQRIIPVGVHSERPPPPPPADIEANSIRAASAPAPLVAREEEPSASAPAPASAPPPAPAPAPTSASAPAPAPAPASAPAPAPAPAPASPSPAPAEDRVEAPVPSGPGPLLAPYSAEDAEEATPTLPTASPLLLDTAESTPSAPEVSQELTPRPPLSSQELAEKAEELSAEDVGPDSGDRVSVEELSREDAPSLPPEAPEPAAPPPAPSARAEGKQPPPPPKRLPAPPPTPETDKKKAKQKRPWWEELFSEDFVRANWKLSDEQIRREVTFVEESLGVAPGGVVLDLGCGSGQHAVELASRGYGVVGYDLSLYQLALAADVAQERSQKINFLQGDMREMAFEEMFDGIFCWNTSFGYFEEDKNFSVAERAFRALRPGGMFLIDVMNRDFVAAHTPSSVWFEGDACVCMDDAVIDYFTSRLRVKRSVILDDGRTRECTYSVRLYSFHELGKLLHDVGFRVTEVSGHPATPGVFLGQASPRILMLAQRP